MGVGKLCSDNFVHFVDVVIKSPRIAIMIQRFEIGPNFDKSRHRQPFIQLLEQVHNLRELLYHPYITPPSIPFRPHQFSRFHRIQWPLQGTGTDILHELLPSSTVTDLSLFGCPTHLRSKEAFTALLGPSPSRWIDNLVMYMGNSYPIEGLSENAKIITSLLYKPALRRNTPRLSEQEALKPACRYLNVPPFARRTVSPSLLPRLFPNLQSFACFSLQLGTWVRDFS